MELSELFVDDEGDLLFGGWEQPNPYLEGEYIYVAEIVIGVYELPLDFYTGGCSIDRTHRLDIFSHEYKLI